MYISPAFSFLSASIALIVLVKCRLGTTKSAPRAVLESFPAPAPNGCGVIPVVITSLQPQASAVRKIEPTLNALRRLSSTIVRGNVTFDLFFVSSSGRNLLIQ